MLTLALILMPPASVFALDHEKSNITARFSADSFVVVEKSKPLKKVSVSWHPMQLPTLAKGDLALISKENYVSAFCSISSYNNLTNYRVAESTVKTKNAHKIYIRILESITSSNCGIVLCSEVKVAVRLSVFAPEATGVSTNHCVAPFCMPESQPAMPLFKPKLP